MKEINLISIADNPATQEQGLKYVRSLPENSGMLFSFEQPRILSFWMQDTYLPLDIAFIDRYSKIVKIEGMIPLSLRSVTSGYPCTMALEVPMGMFKMIGVEVGQKVEVDKENSKILIHDEGE